MTMFEFMNKRCENCTYCRFVNGDKRNCVCAETKEFQHSVKFYHNCHRWKNETLAQKIFKNSRNISFEQSESAN